MAKNNPIREQYEALTGSLAQSPRACRWEKLLEWPHGPGGKRSVIFCGANPWSQAILNKSKILATAGWKIHGWSTCVWGRGGCHRKESQLYLVTVCEYPVGPLMGVVEPAKFGTLNCYCPRCFLRSESRPVRVCMWKRKSSACYLWCIK